MGSQGHSEELSHPDCGSVLGCGGQCCSGSVRNRTTGATSGDAVGWPCIAGIEAESCACKAGALTLGPETI